MLCEQVFPVIYLKLFLDDCITFIQNLSFVNPDHYSVLPIPIGNMGKQSYIQYSGCGYTMVKLTGEVTISVLLADLS